MVNNFNSIFINPLAIYGSDENTKTLAKVLRDDCCDNPVCRKKTEFLKLLMTVGSSDPPKLPNRIFRVFSDELKE